MNTTAVACFVLLPLVSACAAPEPGRVQEVAAMLDAKPAGVGVPAEDRAAWAELAALPAFEGVIKRAENTLKTPLGPWPDELYLEFSKNGNRTNWQRVEGERRARIDDLALAECLEYQGRFLPALREAIAGLCAEPTWVMPAHDGKLANYKGETIDIDLASSAMAWNLATVDWLLGDKLGAETRELLRENVARRVLEPYRAMASDQRPRNWWMTTTNNWNAVCLAGVTGAALTLLPDRNDRAFYIVAAEDYSKNFLKGFTPDGYCSEGIGYWNYGYGHYILLAEAIYQATAGGLDLQQRPEALAPATFSSRTEIINKVYPAFADCGLGSRPSSRYMAFLERKLGLASHPDLRREIAGTSGYLFEVCLFSFPNSATAAPNPDHDAAGIGLRSWFKDAGILLSRPAAESGTRMAVALKGGHNNEHHNHNDVGSYVVVLGRTAVLLDPGAETYTARTFSSRRYESKLLNSYGHPVPVVAGKLQKPGAAAKGEILAEEFNDQQDRLRLSLSSCYDVPELTKLEREWVYDRGGLGSLTVTDTVAYSSPQAFETALITLGGYRETGPGQLQVWDFDEAVDVTIDTGGQPYELVTDQIVENARAKPYRLAIKLKQPVAAATVKVTIVPHVFASADGASTFLKNGDFKLGGFAWQLDGMTTIIPDPLGGDAQVMKVADESTETGSNVNSARFDLPGGKAYELRGKVYGPGQPDGVGLYLRMYDADDNKVSKVDERGWDQPVGSVGKSGEGWQPFAFRFDAPPNCVSANLWIHSYNGGAVTACLADLRLVPVD